MTADDFGVYDFGLGEDEERRAKRLHDESLIIDLMYWGPNTYRDVTAEMQAELQAHLARHADPFGTVWQGYLQPGEWSLTGRNPAYHDSWAASGIDAGHYPMQIGDESWLLRSSAHVQAVVDGHPWIRKVLTAQDLHEARAQGQLAFFLQCQPIVPLSRDLTLIERAYALGLRMLQLTYNNQDHVGAGCTERNDAGLSNFGVEVVRRCNELGIIIDTGHCGRQTTLDAVTFSETPVIASHTAAESVYRHARGKSDEEIDAIAESGGVIGVVTVPFFLEDGAAVTIEAMLDHIDYVAQRVGWQHVAIGTDWPVAGSKWLMEIFGAITSEIGFREEDGIATTQNLVGFDDYRDFGNITRGLVARGYDDEQVSAILGGNALRVFEQVIG